MPEYAELHCHSAYSFQEGASHVHELAVRAKALGYPALALTDHDNLVGALEFAKAARGLGVRPITGAEVTLAGGHHLTLLAATRQGYNNLSRLISHAHMQTDRRHPEAAKALLAEHAAGLIALSGCPRGEVPALVQQGRMEEAAAAARRYRDWFGDGYYLELQHNLVFGDDERVRGLRSLGARLGMPVVATNNAHYHVRERHRLQDCLVAIHACRSLEESHRERRPNREFYLKPPALMAELFAECPEALRATLAVAERCEFDVTRDLAYQFPLYPAPEGHTPDSYLAALCYDAARRRYGRVTERVRARLEEELALVRRQDLAGFFLIYRDVIELAHGVMLDLGLAEPGRPLEENPPGRGRGSSVAMLIGYLIGLSHIDPLQYGLSLERFLPGNSNAPPDIDLDFPRNIREELIKRVHAKWGWDHAALTGMISTYKARGVIRDLGKALGLPPEDLDKLAKRVDRMSSDDLRSDLRGMPDFKDKLELPGWRDFVELAQELDGLPKGLAQHPGGMIISSAPLIDLVPVQPGAIAGRYLCQWDKDSVDDAGMVKIDFLALGALSQMQEAVALIETRHGKRVDLSRIDFEDPEVYRMLHEADTIGIFQVESAAQMQTIVRLQPRDLVDMAHEVACVRPGVGVHHGVAKYLARRLGKAPVEYDHPLEERALARTHGIILFQDQVNAVCMDVAGFSAGEADQLRRAFSKRRNRDLLLRYWHKFRDGAAQKGVPLAAARAVFRKFNGEYMFPEAHAFAFGITAYQAAWLKRHYPLEFYTGLFNEQPMGFWSPETLKEDARRHDTPVLTPDINRSLERCTTDGEALRLGFRYVDGVGEAVAQRIVAERAAAPYTTVAGFMERTGLVQRVVENLVEGGAFDGINPDRRTVLQEVGLRYRPAQGQLSLDFPVEPDFLDVPPLSPWQRMEGEYRTLGLHPEGHVMAHLRRRLGEGVLPSHALRTFGEGAVVTTAGLVVRRQHPLAQAVFLTIEDEFGHTPLVVWPAVYQRYRLRLKEAFIVVTGTVSRRDGTFNVVVQAVRAFRAIEKAPRSKDWR